MPSITLQQGNCLELLKGLDDSSIDIIFCDPPYALGSEVIIKADGKPDYKKAVDFMNKWDQPDGTFWEEWFIEAKRVLKHGGHCLMFGMDRQLWFNCYYANLSGFTQKQSLYWYFISNFPKASDLSKNLDKYFGAEREVVGKSNLHSYKTKENGNLINEGLRQDFEELNNITAPTTPLAKKYNGIKYSVAPLKQTNETIMVFQKPHKTGSCLHDVLALENGDDTITCGGVDIEGNRCGVSGGGQNGRKAINETFNLPETEKGLDTGRFPAQTYIDSGASEIIDLQSGVQKSHTFGKGITQNKSSKTVNIGGGQTNTEYLDSGGASRILHKCDYELEDFDLYHYCPKVSKAERNEGLEGFENNIPMYEEYHRQNAQNTKGIDTPFAGTGRNGGDLRNNHPTVKPKALLSKILKLFKTPNDQVLLDPFMGSGSMGISAVETGFDYIGYELDPDYFKIAEARIENTEQKQKQPETQLLNFETIF
jgi:site-specific DNA-methyltransferase (adenine-specific)